jgi:hypothetical protein
MNPHRIHDAVKTLRWKPIVVTGACVVFTACALVLFAGGAHGKGDAGDVSVVIEPQEILLGDAAVLAVHITGESPGRPSIPKVEGLRLVPMGQSSQYQSVNGRISQIASYLFQVEPERSGDFTLPPVTATVNGEVRKSQPVRLSVSGTGGGSGSARPRAASQGDTAGLSAEEENQLAFIRVAPLKLRAYVGERVPVAIKAFFRQGLQATLNSFPTFSGQAFSCQELSRKPEQTEEIINGVPYAVLTWHTAISAVKEGEHPVATELDAVLTIPQTSSRRHSPGRGFFDDDFFDRFFTGARQETVRLTSATTTMRVLPLPKAGRPENFSGAVGQFKLRASASPQDSMVGDPINLKMSIEGTGNFDRVSCPHLASSEGWRTYSPTSAFKPKDSGGYEGRKSFERAVIPLDASIEVVPSLLFSYFDTAKEKYVTLKTRPIQVKIAPDSGQARTRLSENGDSKKPLSGKIAASDSHLNTDGLAPIRVNLGSVTANLSPVFENPWFIGAQGIPLSALFVGLFMGRRNRRLAGDPSILRKREAAQQIGQSVREMDRAIAGHDVQGFFMACRKAAQERLGQQWAQAPESITLADIKARMGDRGEGIREIFETADAVTYSGRTFTQEELLRFRDVVMRELKNEE